MHRMWQRGSDCRPKMQCPWKRKRSRRCRRRSIQLLRWTGLRAEDVVEHEVDDDAGDGNVHPDGVGPAGDSAVANILLAECAGESDDHEWHDCCGEDGVADEDGEVEGARPALSLKAD